MLEVLRPEAEEKIMTACSTEEVYTAESWNIHANC